MHPIASTFASDENETRLDLRTRALWVVAVSAVYVWGQWISRGGLTRREFGYEVAWSLIDWSAWAAAAPVVLALAARWPLSGPSWRRNLSIHVVACLASTPLWSLALVPVLLFFSWSGVEPYRVEDPASAFMWLLVGKGPLNSVVYVLLIAYATAHQHALASRRDVLRDAELAERLAAASHERLLATMDPLSLSRRIKSISRRVATHPSRVEPEVLELATELKASLRREAQSTTRS